MSDLERAENFLVGLQERISERVVQWEGGVAYLHSELPKVWDMNKLRVERAGLSAQEIEAAADHVMGQAGCEHRRVWVPDEEIGAELAEGFAQQGWEADVHVVMVHRREPDRTVDTSMVRELGDRTWVSRVEQLHTYPWYEPNIDPQMRALYDLTGQAVDKKDFGIVEDGKVVSFGLLLSDGTTGQIEDVATLEGYRNRGLSRRVVSKALEVSRADHDFTFLVADDRDWPKQFYSKLGFDELGRHYFFLKKPPE